MRALVAVLVLCLAGCGTPMGRDKPGASDQDFSQARYQCLQESSAMVSGAAVNSYGGVSRSSMQCNYQMYDACMTARGFYLAQNGRFSGPVNCK